MTEYEFRVLERIASGKDVWNAYFIWREGYENWLGAKLSTLLFKGFIGGDMFDPVITPRGYEMLERERALRALAK